MPGRSKARKLNGTREDEPISPLCPLTLLAVRQKTLLEFLDYDYYGVVKLQPNVAMPSGIGMKILFKKDDQSKLDNKKCR